MAASVSAWTVRKLKLPFTGTTKVVGETGRRASIGRGGWNKVKREGRRCSEEQGGC